MTYTQAQALKEKVLVQFPWLQEVNINNASLKKETYFVGLWFNSEVLLTLSSVHQFNNLVAFIERAACRMEVAS